jgi:peptidoglycan/xylan/chitin deacetylase (PgdA/CDA1 family)
MDLLVRLTTPVLADRREPLSSLRNHVAVTFDDGLTSFSENAWPELEKRGIPAVLFVVAEKVGTIPAWTNYTAGLMPTESMLTTEQLRLLSDRVLVGSHSCTHRMLTRLTLDDARREIERSRCLLQEMLGRNVTLFSFPYGEFSDELIACCKAAGYQRVFTGRPVLALSDPNEFATGRVDVTPNEWRIEFCLKALGAYRWLPIAFSAKRLVMRTVRRGR